MYDIYNAAISNQQNTFYKIEIALMCILYL